MQLTHLDSFISRAEQRAGVVVSRISTAQFASVSVELSVCCSQLPPPLPALLRQFPPFDIFPAFCYTTGTSSLTGIERSAPDHISSQEHTTSWRVLSFPNQILLTPRRIQADHQHKGLKSWSTNRWTKPSLAIEVLVPLGISHINTLYKIAYVIKSHTNLTGLLSHCYTERDGAQQ